MDRTFVSLTLDRDEIFYQKWQTNIESILCSYKYYSEDAPLTDREMSCEREGKAYMINFASVEDAKLKLTHLSFDLDCKVKDKPVAITNYFQFKFSCIDPKSKNDIQVALLEKLPARSAVIIETPGVLPLRSNKEVLGEIMISNPGKSFELGPDDNGYVDSLFNK